MKTKEIEKVAEILNQEFGKCVCDPAWKDRGMVDSRCMRCEWGNYLAEHLVNNGVRTASGFEIIINMKNFVSGSNDIYEVVPRIYEEE